MIASQAITVWLYELGCTNVELYTANQYIAYTDIFFEYHHRKFIINMIDNNITLTVHTLFKPKVIRTCLNDPDCFNNMHEFLDAYL